MSQTLYQSSIGAAAVAAQAAKTKPVILIAEDSLDGREMLGTLLQLKGYDVVCAENGVQALEVALTASPDLMLVDLELPRLDGLNVARNIRRNARLQHVPIVIVSGHDPEKHRQAALDAGCTDYLMKPIDFSRLDAILKHNVPLEV